MRRAAAVVRGREEGRAQRGPGRGCRRPGGVVARRLVLRRAGADEKDPVERMRGVGGGDGRDGGVLGPRRGRVRGDGCGGRRRVRRQRDVLSALLSPLAWTPALSAPLVFGPAFALTGEFGAQRSDLSQSVRRGMVHGAQLIDNIDGRWEKFLDGLGLGANRNKEKRNVLDTGDNGVRREVVRSPEDPGDQAGKFDEDFAYGMLAECDEVSYAAFVSRLKSQSRSPSASKDDLERRVDDVKRLVRKSFFPDSEPPSARDQLNFGDFESSVGRRLLRLVEDQGAIVPRRKPSAPPPDDLAGRLRDALSAADDVAKIFRSSGLVSSWERSVPPEDDVKDFAAPASPLRPGEFRVPPDVVFSLSFYGDATLGSQLLLQESGYRSYPAFGRWMAAEGASRCFE
ncbi:hypothetical protein ACHAWF_001719, partial [Thalassiosira exigua]